MYACGSEARSFFAGFGFPDIVSKLQPTGGRTSGLKYRCREADADSNADLRTAINDRELRQYEH